MDERRRAIGPVGTSARAVIGLGLLYITLIDAPFKWGLAWHEAALGLVGFPLATVFGVMFWRSLAGADSQISAMGHVGLCVSTAIVVALFITPYTSDAVVLFLGAAMLLAAVRGYAGCEVTAFSNWLVHRNDQVGCVVFFPLDKIEARLIRSEQGA